MAIAQARALADEIGVPARFVCGNVLDAPALLDGETFDVVFTSYGVLTWLPDLRAWARAAAACLRPGGTLHVVEFHPAIWMWSDDFTHVQYPYDGGGVPIALEEKGTYADREAPITVREVAFTHGLGTVVTALLDAGLQLSSFSEFDFSPQDIFPDSEEAEPGRFRMRAFGAKLPYVFALSCYRR